MKKIYIVREPYGDNPLGVYSTEELARQSIVIRNQVYPNDYYITETDIDGELPKLKPYWMCHIGLLDGEVLHQEERKQWFTSDEDLTKFNRELDYKEFRGRDYINREISAYSYTSREHALAECIRIRELAIKKFDLSKIQSDHLGQLYFNK